MKNFSLLLCVLLSSFTVHAADWSKDTPPPEWNGSAETYRLERQQLNCNSRGLVFSAAADVRDRGSSPEVAFGLAKQWTRLQLPGLDEKFVKNAVNAVYFDPSFTNAGGERLARQIEDLCLSGGKPKFQPLK